jgi:hypothetical protein
MVITQPVDILGEALAAPVAANVFDHAIGVDEIEMLLSEKAGVAGVYRNVDEHEAGRLYRRESPRPLCPPEVHDGHLGKIGVDGNQSLPPLAAKTPGYGRYFGLPKPKIHVG